MIAISLTSVTMYSLFPLVRHSLPDGAPRERRSSSDELREASGQTRCGQAAGVPERDVEHDGDDGEGAPLRTPAPRR